MSKELKTPKQDDIKTSFMLKGEKNKAANPEQSQGVNFGDLSYNDIHGGGILQTQKQNEAANPEQSQGADFGDLSYNGVHGGGVFFSPKTPGK